MSKVNSENLTCLMKIKLCFIVIDKIILVSSVLKGMMQNIMKY